MAARILLAFLIAMGFEQALAKPKAPVWQTGEITAIAKPGEQRAPGWGTVGPHTAPLPDHNIVLTSSEFGARWALEITLPEAVYVITVAPFTGTHPLAKIKAGDRLDCAVEGKTMSLRDAKGKVYRARIRKRDSREGGQRPAETR